MTGKRNRERARGFFVLSRAVGILANSREQSRLGGRNKGPTPPEFLYSYKGRAPRHLGDGED